MSSPVTLLSDFKLNNVSFKEPKKNAVGGTSILLNYFNDATKKSGPLILQTPKVRIPFGSATDLSDNGIKKYSVNVSLAHGDNSNANLKVFSEIIRVLDQKTKEFAFENSEEWFGKKQKAEVIEEFYKSAEKKAKNDKYANTLKLKLPVKKGIDNNPPSPLFDIYNDSKEIVNIVQNGDIDLSCLEKGSEIVAIIQCTGVWFVGKSQFGLGWKVIQLKTYKNQRIIGYSIVDDDPEEQEEVEEVEVEVEEEVDAEEDIE